MSAHTARRPIRNSGLEVSPVALGSWPMAGVSTLDVNDDDSIATIRAGLDLGINHIDTAYVYGRNGESEKLIGRALEGHRDEVVLATKCGIHYEGDGMVNDARPETLKAECEESLRRLATDHVELLYLHSPDPHVPITASAGALRELMEQGKVRAVGVSNASVDQLEEFRTVCAISAVQLPFNMLQRDVEEEIIPWCQRLGIAVIVYWVLMKGLLAGRLERDQPLATDDARRNYPMYQGKEWRKNQDFVEKLRQIAEECHCTVAQLVVSWTIQRTGISAALCGAKRPWQIVETAGAIAVQLSPFHLAAIDQAIARRGPAAGMRLIR